MNTPDRVLRLELVEPKQPVRVSIGEVFAVTAQVVTTRVFECEIRLMFDKELLNEVSGNPDRQRLHGEGRISQKISWRFKARRATQQTYVTIEGHGEGLFQKIEFPLEVTR
jgi:hypothetical protein